MATVTPKGFDEVVRRLRKQQIEKEIAQIYEEKAMAGDRYSRERLERMKPPSFLNKKHSIKKTLISIEVSITPTKSGRVSIKEGDDLHKVAFNFCRTYQLGTDMQMSLEKQLTHHLENYYKQQRIVDKTKN